MDRSADAHPTGLSKPSTPGHKKSQAEQDKEKKNLLKVAGAVVAVAAAVTLGVKAYKSNQGESAEEKAQKYEDNFGGQIKKGAADGKHWASKQVDNVKHQADKARGETNHKASDAKHKVEPKVDDAKSGVSGAIESVKDTAKSLTGQASNKADSAKDSASRKADKAGNKAEGQYKEGKKAWWQFWKNDVQEAAGRK